MDAPPSVGSGILDARQEREPERHPWSTNRRIRAWTRAPVAAQLLPRSVRVQGVDFVGDYIYGDGQKAASHECSESVSVSAKGIVRMARCYNMVDLLDNDNTKGIRLQAKD